MLFKLKKTTLLALGITAIIGSRTLFFFFDDPEGPNLLIVTVVAAFTYLVSLMICVFSPVMNDAKKFFAAIFIQILILSSLYVLGVTF